MAYLPPAVVDALASGRPLPTPGSAEQLGVVVVFTDIVGFTPLSEALGAVGSSGTEQLSLLLNAYFDEMLGVIESYGGRVVKFGGDALTIVFPLRTAHDGATARRALQCGLDMQAAMGAFAHVQTLAGDFSLAIRVGVAAGTVWSVVLGDPDRRLEQVVAGRPIRLSVAAQAAACHGEVAADRSVLALCPGAVTWPLTARARRVERLARRPQRPAARPLKPATVPAAAAAYLHRSIADRLAAGHEAFVDEHRRVSVLFAGLGEVDLSRATAVTRLDASVRRAVKVIERLGGHLYQIDVSDKGFVLIALFGAPLAHDDDERRALHCALGLRAVWPRRARIGVNAGRVFCGQLGARRRLQYGALGDAVNLAARLMEAARPGQILVSEDAGGRVRGHFELPPIGPLGVKGKARPVAVLELGADAAPVLEEPPARFPLVGRGSELEQARALVAAALRGRGGALEVRGQAGVGKSRLAAEIAASARASGMLVLAGAAQPYADQAAYREWRAPLRGLLGLRERSGVAAVRELDHALEHIEPGLAARAPLLASPLNLRIPETELTRRLPPELRAELLCSMVLTCLRSASRRRPLLVLLEDGHWMGEPSRGLLEHVVRNLSELSMLVVVTGRHAQGEPPPLEPTSQVKLLELGELAAASTEELAALALSTAFAEAEPPPRLVTAVAERSGGNPLFVEELVSFLRGVAATVEEAAETAGPLGQLPDTLHSVVLARVDQLGEDEKATLKVASVIGRRFPAGWVSGSAPELGGREAVTRCLGALAAADADANPRGAATRRAPLQARGHARRGLREHDPRPPGADPRAGRSLRRAGPHISTTSTSSSRRWPTTMA